MRMVNALYRGLRIDGKGWVYGCVKVVSDYRRGGSWYYIYVDGDEDTESNEYQVIPITVGQYTGYKDKNGLMVFMGDKFNPISKNLTYVVVFKDAQFGLESELGYWGSLKRYYELAERHNWSYKVIGTIHESNGTNLQ